MKKENKPIAHICINKSRVKIYDKETDPKIYLSKQTEFQIELFNPTTDVVLAKIILNGTALSQGGLVLNPGQRVFLDRYFDVAKKFLFDTYEVSKSSEVMEAIKNNGDIKVEFYRESKPMVTTITVSNPNIDWTYRPNTYYNQTAGGWVHTNSSGTLSTQGGIGGTLSTQGGIGGSAALYSSSVDYSDDFKSYNNLPTLDSFQDVDDVTPQIRSRSMSKKLSKTIETGRVEQGSASDQSFKVVDKKFDYFAFHTLEYKLLPISQKINTVADISVKRYCSNCGAKVNKTDKFCSNCGTRV